MHIKPSQTKPNASAKEKTKEKTEHRIRPRRAQLRGIRDTQHRQLRSYGLQDGWIRCRFDSPGRRSRAVGTHDMLTARTLRRRDVALSPRYTFGAVGVRNSREDLDALVAFVFDGERRVGRGGIARVAVGISRLLGSGREGQSCTVL